MFDNEIKGGLFATNLLGKPVKRLTPGTGESLGKLGELVNKARFAGSAIPLGTGLTKLIGGEAGQTYAAVKKGLLEETKAAQEAAVRDAAKAAEPVAENPMLRQRFIDYVSVKDALHGKTQDFISATGRSTAVAANVIHEAKQFPEADRPIFNEYRDKAFIGKPVTPEELANPAAKAGFDAGQTLAKDVDYMHDIADANGIKIAKLGDPSNPNRRWSSLILSPESIAKLRAKEGARMSDAEYSTTYARDAYYNFIRDMKEAEAEAFPINPQNPNVIALDAKSVNELYKKMDPNTDIHFIEDAVQAHQMYAADLNRKIANKRFLDRLEAAGAVVRDNPQVVSVINTKLASLFLSTVSKLAGAEDNKLSKFATELDAKVTKDLKDLVAPKTLRELQSRIVESRVAKKNVLDVAVQNEKDALAKVDESAKLIEEKRPRMPEYLANMKKFSEAYTTTTAEKQAAERVARSLRAKMARANTNIQDAQDMGPWLLRASAEAAAAGDNLMATAYRQVHDEYLTRGMDSITKAAKITTPLRDAEQELVNARAASNMLDKGTVAEQRQLIADFENALNEHANNIRELEKARADRRKARADFMSVKSEFYVEKSRTVKTVVDKYRAAYAEKKAYDLATRRAVERMRREAKFTGMSEEALDTAVADFKTKRADLAVEMKLAENLDAAKDMITKLKKIIPGTQGKAAKHMKEVSAYIDSLVSMATKLTDDQFQVALVLQSEETLQKHVENLAGEALVAGRKDREVQQALGDMYAAFKDVRPLLKNELSLDERKALLSDEERKFLSEDYLAGVKGKLTSEDKRASEVGAALQEAGLQKVGVNKATMDLYAASGIKQLMEHLYRTEVDPTGWKKWINDVLDPLLGVWKQTVTLGRGPGYLATNVIGGLFMNYLGNVSVADMKVAFGVVKKLESKLKALETASPDVPFFQHLDEALTELGPEWRKMKIGDSNLEALFKEFVARGAFFSTETGFAATQIAKMGALTPEQTLRRGAGYIANFEGEPTSKLNERYRAAINWAVTNRYQMAMTNASQLSEMFLRLAPFIDGYRRYGNFATAMDKVHMLQYDYRDLSDAEQWLRRLVPFYTWSRNNIPAQLRAIALQPGKIQRALYANQEFQNAYGVGQDDSWLNQVLPEYLQTANGFASNWTFGDNNLGFFLKLPFEDINNMFQVGEKGIPTVRGKALTNMLGPFIKAPIEMATGTNLSTGAPSLPGGEKVPGYYNIFRPLGLVSTGPEGETRANAALARGIGDLLPFLGTGERAASAASALIPGQQPNLLFSENQQAAGLSNLLNLTGIAPAFGMSAATLSTGSISGEVRRRTDIQNADIKSLAAQKDLDVDWIRQQLRLGRTPQQIAMLIEAGQGKLGASQGSDMKAATKQRYIQQLGSLGSPQSA